MAELEILANECMTVISMLINLYEKAEINHEVFIEHTKLKIEFLSSNLEKIKDLQVKSRSEQLLSDCAKLLGKDASNGILCNTQV